MDGENHLIWYPGHELLIDHIIRAENCSLFDADGKRYVDLEAGVWCTPLGHRHPRILSAISKHSASISHTGFNYSSGIVEQAAQSILSLLGFDDGKCIFLCSGSEAVEFGVRTAQEIISRPLLMTMSDSYCGAYGSASSKSEKEWFCFDWKPCASCPDNLECNDTCEHWKSIPYNTIGGFLLEPGSSSGLVRFPPKKLIQNIVAAIRIHDGIVLVNEVTTGVGRTGRWFGYQHYGISPDIVALGKGIGNGYPVSVAAFSAGVKERLGGRIVKYAQSHQNDPLGASVANEVVEIIRDQGLLERGRSIASVLVPCLEEIRDRTDRIKEIRSRGLMVALDMGDNTDTQYTVEIHRELVHRGYIVGLRPGVNVLRLDPSLTIEEEDIRGFLDAFGGILKE